MDRIILNSTTIKNAQALKLRLAATNAYFIVEDELPLPTGETIVGKGSLLDFRGGRFTYSPLAEPILDEEKITVKPSIPELALEAKLNLNGAIVIAGAYCIFSNVKVSGFQNMEVKAEWFNSGQYENSAQIFINEAIKAAWGCPVYLEHKTYNLSGSIVFPEIGQIRQTLISPGILHVSSDIPAIEIDVYGVCLEINSISGVKAPTEKPEAPMTETADKIVDTDESGVGRTFLGTGILLTGRNYRLNINIFQLINLHKGIAVCPRTKYVKSSTSSKEQQISGAVQYCRIKFQEISADNCFYVKLFPSTKVENENDIKKFESIWFTESKIEGGQMQGHNGIYFVPPFICPKKENEDEKEGTCTNFKGSMALMNGLIFDNIGLERLSGIPMRISNMKFSYFTNLRMMEGLPGLINLNDKDKDNVWDSKTTWVHFEDVSDIEMSVKGYIRPNHFKNSGSCTNVVVRGNVLDDEGWYINHFDTMVFMPIWNPDIEGGEDNKIVGGFETKMVATSSIQPYNMTKLLIANDADPNSGITATKMFYLRDLLPENNTVFKPDDNSGCRIAKFNVLPRTLNVIVEDDNEMILDLTGLSRFAPSVIDVCAMVTPGGRLTFRVSQFPDYMTILPEVIRNQKEYTFNENGLFRLTWDDKWVLQISRIIT